MIKLLILIASIFFTINCFSNERFINLKKELELLPTDASLVKEQVCHLYIVHHGDTDYTIEERLQGWIDIPLNDVGREQMQTIADQLADLPVDVIYSSSLGRAVESASILAQNLNCEVIIDPDLRGESHGNLEGLKKKEYEKDPHYQQYKSLPSEEQIFFSVGANGLSKADVARFAIPALKKICQKHPGKNVVIVTHGGVLKFINFLLGDYTPEQINEVPHGELLRADGDGTHLFLSAENTP